MTTESVTARPEPGTTSARIDYYQLRRRVLEVVRTEHITPAMRRVVLGGDDLEADFPFVPMAVIDHVKVFFPDPATGQLALPLLGERGIQRDPDGPELIYRDYTVRAFDRARRELTLDFVLHTHGVAGNWAARAAPGDRVGVLGPRGSRHQPTGYAWYLIAGDPTALPAISRWVEELPATARATVVIEVDGPQEQQPLSGPADVELRWVYRDPAGPGVLERALRDIELPDHDDYFVWVAGEAGELKPIRRYFRREVGVPAERLDLDGYWKRGVINLDHHTDDGDTD